MLSLVNVKHKTITRYKQEEAWIPEGTYYRFGGRPNDLEKKIYSLIACGGVGGWQFMWLAVYEPWVKRFKDGQLMATPRLDEEPNWDMIGINPNILRSWQKLCITETWNYLRSGIQYGRGWIAKMGAGKTLAGLCVGQMFEQDEVAVLVDRYLFGTWEKEADEWGLNTPLLSTYESCHKLPSTVKCLIIDEILRLKSPEAQRSMKATAIASKCEVAIGFTGIATGGKGPLDFRWLRSIIKGCVPANENAWKFKFGLDTELKEVGPNKAYITTKWDTEAIAEFVAPFTHTVDPDDINKELPEYTDVYIECPRPKEYELVKSGGATASGVHKKLSQLRQITDGFVYDDNKVPMRIANPKLKKVIEFVENLGEPIVLVSNWTEGIAILSETFAEYNPAVVQGGCKDASAEIARFTDGKTRMLIANAGFSKGMNLQHVCRVVAFLSVSSKPDDQEQMRARVWRPGQKHAVQFVYFTCKDTMDRHIITLVQNHKEMDESFIEKLLIEELTKEQGF